MYALTTLFDINADTSFAQMWQRLRTKCGLVTANEISFVHLSWQGATAYEMGHASVVLQEIAAVTRAFTVKISGIGLFTGKQPVLFLNIVKNRKLLELHEVLWARFKNDAKELNAFYAPEEWVPHVTLTYNPLSHEALTCAVAELMNEPFTTELMIDNLAWIYLQDRTVGIDSRFELRSD